jgi:hypothetical protein
MMGGEFFVLSQNGMTAQSCKEFGQNNRVLKACHLPSALLKVFDFADASTAGEGKGEGRLKYYCAEPPSLILISSTLLGHTIFMI